jgi:hypothetical protein
MKCGKTIAIVLPQRNTDVMLFPPTTNSECL